jgi:hypothetical protein
MTAINRYRYRAAEQLQQHLGASGTIEAHQLANEVSKRPSQYLYTLPDSECVAEIDETVRIRNID